MLMTKATRRGRELREELGLSGQVDGEEVAEMLGLEVVELCLTSLEEFIGEGYVVIASDLPPDMARWTTAHAIGHYMMHPGNQYWLKQRTKLEDPYERQAEDFAWGLLVDPAEAQRSIGYDVLELNGWDLAEYFGVPEDLVKKLAGGF